MNNGTKYIARIYENDKHMDTEFNSPELPMKFYFSSEGCLYPEITKVELIEKLKGIEKIIRTRRLTKK